MSTIRVDNFAPSTGGTSYSSRGIAKVWAQVDNTVVISLSDGENIASLTDEAIGVFSANITNNWDDINFCAAGCANGGFTVNAVESGSLTTITSAVRMLYTNNAGAFTDAERNHVLAMGDLA